MPTLEEIKLRLTSIDRLDESVVAQAIEELPNILYPDELPEDGLTGTYNGSLGILVATNERILFIHSGELQKVIVEVFQYEQISRMEYFLTGKIVLVIMGQKISISDIARDHHTKIYSYIFERISPSLKASDQPSVSTTQSEKYDTRIFDIEKEKQADAWWKIKNSLFMLIGIVPYLTFIPLLIMSIRVKRQNYFWLAIVCFSPTLFYFIGNQKSVRLLDIIMFQWMIGIVYFFIVREKFLVQLAVCEGRRMFMNAVSEKQKESTTNWTIKNSLFLLPALFYLTIFLSFFIIAYQTKRRKYYAVSFLYLLPSLLKNAWGIGFALFVWVIGIIHLFVIRKSYLQDLAVQDVFFKNEYRQGWQGAKIENIEYKSNDVSNALIGNEHIQKMQQLNVAITDEKISDYLDEMEKICKNIFDYVDKHPDKMGQIQSFVNYYLPETFKLLERYDELSRRSVKNANITQSMSEISDVLETILEAFKNLYNKLFQDESLHISTDIKVLKDVLTQHGLTKESSQFDLQK